MEVEVEMGGKDVVLVVCYVKRSLFMGAGIVILY